MYLKGNSCVKLNKHLNCAQNKLTFYFLYEVSGSIRSDADEDHPYFLVILGRHFLVYIQNMSFYIC